MRALLPLLLVVLAACSDPHADARAKAVEEARAALQDEPSRALHLARGALADHGASPELSLIEGLACLPLDRYDEAIDAAETGLGAEELQPDLHADLQWVLGIAMMARYQDLHAPSDWGAANLALERATEAGSHRLQAATALVVLQNAPIGNQDRQLRFARLVLELAPDSKEAGQVTAVLEKKGLKP